MRNFTHIGIGVITISLTLCFALNRAMAADQVIKFIGKAPGICLSTQSENKCRVKSHERLTLQLTEERFIDNIVFIADDKFGDESKAKVDVLLDGQEIAKDVNVMEMEACGGFIKDKQSWVAIFFLQESGKLQPLSLSP